MSEQVHVDRLILDLPGLTAAEARTVAALIGEGLAAAGPYRADSLAIEVERNPGESPQRLAARILAQVLRRIG